MDEYDRWALLILAYAQLALTIGFYLLATYAPSVLLSLSALVAFTTTLFIMYLELWNPLE